MSELFLTFLNMSISASFTVLAVLLIRLILKKAPKWMSVLLWGIVAIRLICPFAFESLIPSAESANPVIIFDKAPGIKTVISNGIIDTIINGSYAIKHQFQVRISGLSVIWIAGIVILLIYAAIGYIRVKGKVKTAVMLKDNIYQCETVISPFILGVIKPKIYLPFNIIEKDSEFVIAHEKAHIRRGDYIWKPFGFLLLALHWFNPLIWLGYILLCRDIELACDEKVVKNMTAEGRADYSETLLSLSAKNRMIAACPLAFGEVGVKARVKNVLSYKKPALWIMILAVASLIITSVCMLTDPKTLDINDLDPNLRAFLDTQVDEFNGYALQNGEFTAISYDLMKVDESAEETSVYAWILYMKYDCENGELKEISGCHVPTVITAKNNGDGYGLAEYWIPGDGNLYVKDIKGKFPLHLWLRALDSQRSIKKQTAECEKMAKEYFHIS